MLHHLIISYSDQEGVTEKVLDIPLPPVAEIIEFFESKAIGVGSPGYYFYVEKIEDAES